MVLCRVLKPTGELLDKTWASNLCPGSPGEGWLNLKGERMHDKRLCSAIKGAAEQGLKPRRRAT